MSSNRTHRSRVAVAIVALAGGIAIPIAVSSRAPAAREIRLVVRNMTYYLDGSSEPNPILHVRRAEPIRIVLRSEDPGLTHDFGVDAWRLRTPLIDDRTNPQRTIQFQAPDTAGDAVYSCSPHAQMMRGTIRVE